MILRLGHLGLTVSDLERARSFYCDLFGFEEFFRVRRKTPWIAAQVGYLDADIEFCHLRHPGIGLHLELCKYRSPRSAKRLDGETYVPGAAHFNLWVDDVGDLLEKIRAYIQTMPSPGLARVQRLPDRRFDLEATTITEGPQTGGKGVYVRTPDGHTIEIWQPAKTEEAQRFGK